MKNIIKSILKNLGKISWSDSASEISVYEKNRIWDLLSGGHFIILTFRSNHLSSYLISISHFLLSLYYWLKTFGYAPLPKLGKFSHSLINIESTDCPTISSDFKLVEAIGKGVVISDFKEVFNCRRVCILEPIIQPEDWQSLVSRALEKIGAEYDYEFNFSNSSKLSCAELVLYVLEGEIDFKNKYSDLVEKLKKIKFIDPQMYRDSGSFRVIYETK
jgi:hypothetical protein